MKAEKVMLWLPNKPSFSFFIEKENNMIVALNNKSNLNKDEFLEYQKKR